MLAFAAWPGRAWLWGLHSLGYLAALPAALLLAGAAAACIRLAREAGIDTMLSREVRAATPAGLMLLSFAAALTFWAFRVRHLLLGDGLPIVASAGAFRLHPLEPLASLIQHGWVVLFAPLFRAVGHHDFYALWYAMALGSALLGGASVIAAYGVARECGRVPGTGADVRTWITLALIVAQGYVLLFCGYVEHYGLLLLAMTVYVWTALRHLGGRGGLTVCGVTLALAVAVHVSALLLAPSFIALAIRADGRSGFRGLGALLLAMAVFSFAFARLEPGYSLPGAIWNAVSGLLVEREGRRFDPLALLNTALLAGPAGILLFGGFMRRARRTGTGREHWWFATTLGLGALAALLLAGPSNLGYARNWDLLAPAGFLLLVAGLVFLRLAEPPGRADRWLLAALIVSALHVVPWVMLNADEEASIRRMADLPLGGGRGETTIGYWSLLRGRSEEAGAWFERAVAASPTNVRARLFLGELLLESNDAREAEAHLLEARRLRPDLAIARALLAKAAWMQGERDAARRELAAVASDTGLPPPVRGRAATLGAALSSADSAAMHADAWRALVASLRGDGVR